MGSSSSRFRKHLQSGDEYAALQLYNNSSDLRKGLDPNLSYGDNYNHDTPLHLAARHAMKSLLRIFLFELSGNPNKKNARDETSLHSVCLLLGGRTMMIQQRRTECLMLILQWRGAELQDGEIEKVDLGAQDEKKNTSLHYAAMSGLKRNVELLVNANAPLFLENELKQTPCDCAEKCMNSEIALYLESKMVFSNEETLDEEEEMSSLLIESQEAYSGLRAQDLQEAKDQLLVETSDMLRVPLFTAEALLRNHEWSREMLLEAWMENAVACCEKCGVVPPSVLFSEPALAQDAPISPDELSTPTSPATPLNETMCDICTCMIPAGEEAVPMACDHMFCRRCWERYLTGKIEEGDAHNITCPAYDCAKLVPVDILETLVSRDMARRYLQFDIKAFVDSNPNIKWCPYPGCGRAVRLPDNEGTMSPMMQATSPGMGASSSDTSRAVDCGNGHCFCWECLGESHEPASCENWSKWYRKIAEIKPEELHGTENETESAANCLWLVTNSKPCPQCKSPIQKNEGCNHMKCSKCKHDFCWVCLEPWKKHSSATGGYFRCNRYEVVKKVEEYNDSLKADAEDKHKKVQELNKFVHYYTRFKNHENSLKLEEPLLSTAKEKMMILARAVTDSDTANVETKFVEDAVHQLLKARHVLRCSYVYGYYLEETGYKKPIFEFMQTELEECTESLSEMIARPYLRTPRAKIIQTAQLVQRKRYEFVTAIAKGLVPPDNSPTLKKKKRRYSLELDTMTWFHGDKHRGNAEVFDSVKPSHSLPTMTDNEEDLRKALLASIQDVDPSNPWMKDPSGKHTNVTALLDWPDDSEESDSEDSPAKVVNRENDTNSENTQTVEDNSTDVSSDNLCNRRDCEKPLAINPRTGTLHSYCSVRCMRMAGIENAETEEMKQPELTTDYHMEMLRALEMSRLQFMRESQQPERPADIPQFEEGAAAAASDTSLVSPPRIQPLLHSPTRLRSPPIISQPPDSTSPKSSRSRVKSSSSGGSPKDRVTTGQVESFDPDLQRALELSRQSISEEDRQLHMAIELSLQDTSPDTEVFHADAEKTSSNAATVDAVATPRGSRSMPEVTVDSGHRQAIAPRRSGPQLSGPHLGGPRVITPFLSAQRSEIVKDTPIHKDEKEQCPEGITEPQFSGVVNKEPNKTAQDAAIELDSEDSVQSSEFMESCDTTGAYGGVPDILQNTPRFLNSDDKTDVRDGKAPAPKMNAFGVIKDLSVSNVYSSDFDKTEDFDKKDLSSLFRSLLQDTSIEDVFEPRPHSHIKLEAPHPPCDNVASQSQRASAGHSSSYQYVNPSSDQYHVSDKCETVAAESESSLLMQNNRNNSSHSNRRALSSSLGLNVTNNLGFGHIMETTLAHQAGSSTSPAHNRRFSGDLGHHGYMGDNTTSLDEALMGLTALTRNIDFDSPVQQVEFETVQDHCLEEEGGQATMETAFVRRHSSQVGVQTVTETAFTDTVSTTHPTEPTEPSITLVDVEDGEEDAVFV